MPQEDGESGRQTWTGGERTAAGCRTERRQSKAVRSNVEAKSAKCDPSLVEPERCKHFNQTLSQSSP